MHTSDYIILGCFLALIIPKRTRFAATTILVGYAVYITAIMVLPDAYYYHGAALLNLMLGYILLARYKLVALCSFSLILVNFIGFIRYENYQEPALYNATSSIVIALQVALLCIRILSDGYRFGEAWRCAMVFLIDNNRSQQNFRVLHPKKKDKKWDR